MQATDRRTRWQNAFIYALVTTIMLTSTIFVVSAFLNRENQELAKRVDRNAAVSVTAADAIICILQLGVSPDDPPRTEANVQECLIKNGYLDIPTQDAPE